MFEKPLDFREWFSGWILSQYVADRVGAAFNFIDGGLVGSRNATGFDGVDLLDQSVCLVCEVADDYVPFGKALVAAVAVWKLAGVTAGARVASGPGHALHAHTVTHDLVALLLCDTSWVTVAR